ncbi:LacI family DNA-binding transcriptional regulator [Streptosporangium sp. NBC_01756]|uniref:LacI family DNA-binding transcriptional regulator n=1 Tax=Streptosporangium sp. NBC_01756 TaxID=2975950 RepID=UPI002DDB4485|nr:LacI family DNA-binding transcriptional regulator [Streptosporangium sp. NBC_01756]WSC87952.1 LacI family transcriptional regulator [Streptosporangium sp. NBC_01756]
MGVTSHDVARLAGVSQPTVSRALRGDPRVSSATRDRVAEAARALGYVASEMGRSLSTRATHQIAMVADLDNPLYPSLIAPLHDALTELGYRMVLFAERGDEMANYERLLDRSVDGAVLTTTRLRSSLPYELSRREFPFVCLTRHSDIARTDTVSSDNVSGGRQAAGLLTGLGHTRIGALLGPADTSTSRDRETGLREGLETAGGILPARWVRRGGFDHQHGFAAFTDLMSLDERPTALFCASDAIAVGALNAATALGIRVPDDIAIVGFDDLDMASWPRFDLTTIRSPFVAMARAAAGLLVGRLSGKESGAPREEVFPVELVLRGTHGGQTPCSPSA